MNLIQPQVGQRVTVYNVECVIFKVRPLGVIDVVAVDGSRAWRLAGCPIYAAPNRRSADDTDRPTDTSTRET